MNKVNNLQDTFINEARKNRIPVIIHIVNGFQFKGIVKSFDNFTLLLENDEKQMLVFKHAITTITPNRNLDISFDAE